MGNVLAVEYFSLSAAHCSCEKEQLKESDCCSNQLEVYQMDQDEVRTSVDSGAKYLPGEQALLQVCEYTALINDNDDDVFISSSLPPPGPLPVYLLTSNLKYYG